MAYILSIESGTNICSVGISKCGESVTIRTSDSGRDHARMVAQFADEVIAEAGIAANELSAVAVSMGPGSYTGLRIGVSFAKGLCYGLSIPLIGVGSLEALTRMAMKSVGEDNRLNFRAMIDARRMEIYTQLFDTNGKSVSEVSAEVMDEPATQDRFKGEESVIFGDGAAKCSEIMAAAQYIDVAPSAVGVGEVAYEKWMTQEFEDVAYCEPFYLKEVVVTKSKKKFF